MSLLAVLAGSALGGLARFLFARLVDSRTGGRFPWGTLAVNTSGALLIGLVLGVGAGSATVDLLLVTGFLGAYTTVSAFSLQTVELIHRRRSVAAAGYAAASIAGCLIAAGAGMSLAGAAW